MHALNQQLNVPVAECREVDEDLLDAKLVCPLGGEYTLEKDASGGDRWTSSPLVGSHPGELLSETVPEGFVAPPLNWFRGLKAQIQILPEALNVHAEILMEQPKSSR